LRTLRWVCSEGAGCWWAEQGQVYSLHSNISAAVDTQGDLALPVLTPQLFEGNCLTLRSYDDYEDTQQGKLCLQWAQYEALWKSHCPQSHSQKMHISRIQHVQTPACNFSGLTIQNSDYTSTPHTRAQSTGFRPEEPLGATACSIKSQCSKEAWIFMNYITKAMLP